MLKKLANSTLQLSAAQNMVELKAALSSAAAELGLVSFNLALNKRHPIEFMEDPLLTTWSESDLQSYVRDGWDMRDPLLQRAVETTAPFLWRTEDWQKMGHHEYAEYLRFNNLSGGVTIPLGQEIDQLGAVTLLSVTDVPLTTETLQAATILAHFSLARAQVLREGISCSEQSLKQLRSLSVHQMSILHWVAQGKSNREIAVIMTSTLRTINYHLEEIRRKLGVSTRVQASAILNGAMNRPGSVGDL